MAIYARGLLGSREKARKAIGAGYVRVNGMVADKPSFQARDEDRIELDSEADRYVGRGGYKLEKALDYFGVVPKGWTVLDIGASTGGFTQCLLRYGAEKVYAVDVGHGQLAACLKEDDRVVDMEGTDIRKLDPFYLFPMAVADVSFISLAKVLPYIIPHLAPGAHFICLIKPQFEAGRGNVSKNGIVKDEKIRIQAVEEVLEFAGGLHMNCHGYIESPIRGGEGNVEYLAYFTYEGAMEA